MIQVSASLAFQMSENFRTEDFLHKCDKSPTLQDGGTYSTQVYSH